MDKLFLFVLVLWLACKNQTTRSYDHVDDEVEQELSDTQKDSLALVLAKMLNPDPQTLLQKQENALVHFAMDNFWPIEKDSNGFFYVVFDEGNGESLEWESKVVVHYRGTFLNGETFDSSYDRGDPLQFYVGNMIPGFAFGLLHFKVGGRGALLIPSYLAYGDNKKSGIPINSPLIFEIEVIEKLQN